MNKHVLLVLALVSVNAVHAMDYISALSKSLNRGIATDSAKYVESKVTGAYEHLTNAKKRSVLVGDFGVALAAKWLANRGCISEAGNAIASNVNFIEGATNNKATAFIAKYVVDGKGVEKAYAQFIASYVLKHNQGLTGATKDATATVCAPVVRAARSWVAEKLDLNFNVPSSVATGLEVVDQLVAQKFVKTCLGGCSQAYNSIFSGK